jgi:hypothetical protein
MTYLSRNWPAGAQMLAAMGGRREVERQAEMKNENLEWSPAYPLFNTRDHLTVRRKSGVYRVRAFTEHGAPLPIPRFAGVDALGILHIGKASDLGRRIGYFRRAAEGGKAAHNAGHEFFEWHFANLIPPERLRFDYIETSTAQEALKLEHALHVEYRRRFLDRPPLDSTSGRPGV